jgi:pimeloyl-ACP methyl ester carboxylesterase
MIWGAPVAWHAALFRPDRLRGVVGLSARYRPRPEPPATFDPVRGGRRELLPDLFPAAPLSMRVMLSEKTSTMMHGRSV